MADVAALAAANTAAIAANGAAMDVGWTIFAGCLVFLMQSGFALLEAGYTSSKNTQSILMKNVVDASVGALGWFLIGYGLAFGEDNSDPVEKGGFIGTDQFAVLDEDLVKDGTGFQYAFFFFQWTFCATAATIVSGALAERCRLEGYIIVSFIMSLFLYPIVVHWTWGGGFLLAKGYNDFAGSGVVHMFGGVVALVGSIILGPRLGRFEQLSAGAIANKNVGKPSSLLHVCLGTLILWFGWFGFNAGSTVGLTGGYSVLAGRCCVTTMLSAAAGGIVSFAIASYRAGKYDVGAFANGILGGLVGITAGCANVDLHLSILIGLISGIIVDGSSQLLNKLKIDDAVGAFPVHGACGVWGVLANGLFDLSKGWWTEGTALNDSFGPQVVGVLAIAAWAVGTTTPMFLGLKAAGLLRVSEEMEINGLDNEFAAGVMQVHRRMSIISRASRNPGNHLKAPTSEGQETIKPKLPEEGDHKANDLEIPGEEV